MSGPGRWRPTLPTATLIANVLGSAIEGRRIEKVWRPSSNVVSIKLQGEPRRLIFDASAGYPHVRLASSWPENPHNPDREVLILRRFLTNGRISNVSLREDRVMAFVIESRGETLDLTLQMAGRFPNITLTSETGEELVRLVHSRPGLDPDSPPLKAGIESWTEDTADILNALELLIEEVIERSTISQKLTYLAREARALGKRSRRACEALTKELQKARRAEEHRSHGELLKSVLHKVSRGMTEINATDWSSGEGVEVVVPLEPLLSPKENLEKLFKRYRKFSGAVDGIETRLSAQRTHKESLDAVLLRLETLKAEPGDDIHSRLEAVESRLKQCGWRPAPTPSKRTSSKKADVALPYREFRAVDGTLIWLGRSAKHNDKLTLQHSRGHDVWLHARDCAGSHVIVRCERNTMPSSDALLDAAMLAAWHSKLRGESVIDVMWTRRKNVRKPKGAAAGSVTVSDSKTISVRDDPERLRRIYQSESLG